MKKIFEKIFFFLFHRTTRYGANLSITLFLVLSIAAAIGYLGFQHRLRWDITKNKKYSLSEQSIKILDSLEKPVRLTYFYQIDGNNLASRKILEQYKHASPKIILEMIDINSKPTLAKQMGVTNFETVVVNDENSERKKNIKVVGISEEKITNGLLRLLKNENQVVYFLSGHSEDSITASEKTRSLSELKNVIENEVYTVKELMLDEHKPEIPTDATVLVIPGPKSDYLPSEFQTITNWVKKNGKLLLSFDLDFQNGKLYPGAKRWADWLANYGLSIGTHLIVDASSQQVQMEAQVLVASADSVKHPISKDFPRSVNQYMQVVHFYFPLSLRLQTILNKSADMELTSIVKTTPNAWEEMNWQEIKNQKATYNKDADYQGVMSIAYAVESKRKQENFRAVVFGTTSFAINSLIHMKNNKDIFLNSLGWLANQESFLSIRSKDIFDGSINIDQSQMNLLAWLFMVITPLFIFAFGIFTWYRRLGK